MSRTIGIVKGALLTDKQSHQLARRLNGMSVLEWVVRQMTDCESLSGVVVIAEEGPKGDVVRKLAPVDAPVFSSARQSTIALLNHVFENFAADAAVFIGSDWPFIDPTIIDQLVFAAESEPLCDYAAYKSMNEIFSTGRPYGLFPEWYKTETLRKIAKEFQLLAEPDEVYCNLPGTYFLDYQDKFHVELLPIPEITDNCHFKFEIDDESDWDNVIALHDALALGVLDYKKMCGLVGSCRREMVGV
ncbi:MAG: NTP transferase domain-containing protein [Thermoguttaceae bacterium]